MTTMRPSLVIGGYDFRPLALAVRDYRRLTTTRAKKAALRHIAADFNLLFAPEHRFVGLEHEGTPDMVLTSRDQQGQLYGLVIGNHPGFSD